ncbi:metallophosphoesterase [Paenibacillus polysaccharolyticus]|uniref:metallophosphoesterase n=1 Tax=Paenibacillus polysaccharolyticus TaxID=582692 RepID=UPI00300BD17D
MWREAHTTVITEDEVELVHLPASFNGARIIFLSDTHSRLLKTKEVEQLKGKADWVLIGGDIAEEGISWSIVRQNMRLLSSLAPTYTVYGNHDKKAGMTHLSRLLHDSSVQLLQDQDVYLQKGTEHVRLVGLDYRSKQAEKLLRNTKDGCSTIVLVHDPLEVLRLDIDVDLILSGHTHGGQIVVPLLGPVLLSKAYRAVKSGWFSLKRSDEDTRSGKLLVSRGFGTNHLPFRLGCPAEIHLITLRVPATNSPDQ